MDYITHSVGGVITGVAVGYTCNKLGLEVNTVSLVVGGLIGGLLPDIDHPKSILGRAVLPIAQLINSIWGHRGMTHSLVFMGAVGTIVALFNFTLGLGIALGILSHIVLDMVEPETNGTCAYYPFKKGRVNWFR